MCEFAVSLRTSQRFPVATYHHLPPPRMVASLLVTLRETLEASLVVGIMLAFLNHTKNREHNPVIWLGVTAGVLCSLIVMMLFQVLIGGFEGPTEQIYEGTTMLLAAGLISWMVIWLARHGRSMRKGIESQLDMHLKAGELFSIFLLVFTSILREGVETVIFLQAAFLQTQDSFMHIGAIAGIVLAIGLAWLLFRGMIDWFPLSRFFRVTGALLMLFGAGLTAHGVHEFQEAGVLPIFIEHVWDTNAFINEEGTLGGILKGLFGYNGNPSLMEIGAYVLYVIAAAVAWKRFARG